MGYLVDTRQRDGWIEMVVVTADEICDRRAGVDFAVDGWLDEKMKLVRITAVERQLRCACVCMCPLCEPTDDSQRRRIPDRRFSVRARDWSTAAKIWRLDEVCVCHFLLLLLEPPKLR